MRRHFQTALLGVVALVAGLPAPARASLGGGHTVVDLLPEKTAGYARVAGLSELSGMIREQGLLEGTEGEEDTKELLDFLDRVEVLHLSFHGIRSYPALTRVQMLAVVEGRFSREVTDWMPRGVPLQLRGEIAGQRVWQVTEPELSEAGLDPHLTVSQGMLVAATSRHMLGDFLRAMRHGQRRPLSRNPDFRQAMDGLEARDLRLYASADRVLRNVADSAGPDREEVRAVSEVLGLTKVRCAAFGADIGDEAAQMRVLMDPHSAVYELLARPSVRGRAPEFLPGDSLLFAAVGLKDGARLWRSFADYLTGKLVLIGEMDDRDEFHEEVAQLETELGFRMEDAAAQVEGEIGFFLLPQPPLARSFCLFGTCREPRRTGQILEQFARNQFGEEIRTHHVAGVAVKEAVRQSRNRFVWAVAGRTVLISPALQPVEAALKARQQGRALARFRPFRDLTLRLPSRHGAMAYLNVGELLRLAAEHRPGALGAAPQEAAVGAALTFNDGTVDIRIARNGQFRPGDYLKRLGARARTDAVKSEDRANLHNIGLGLTMYANDHGQFPPNLAALLEEAYLSDRDVLISRADPTPQLRGGLRTSYEYIGPLRVGGLPPAAIICYTRQGVLPDGRNVLYRDMAVQWVPGQEPSNPRMDMERMFRQVVASQDDGLTEERLRELAEFYQLERVPELPAQQAPEPTEPADEGPEGIPVW